MISSFIRTSGEDICIMLDTWFCWTLYSIDISIQAHELLVSVKSSTAENCRLFSLLFENNGQKVTALLGAFFFLIQIQFVTLFPCYFCGKMHHMYFFRLSVKALMTQKLLLLWLF